MVANCLFYFVVNTHTCISHIHTFGTQAWMHIRVLWWQNKGSNNFTLKEWEDSNAQKRDWFDAILFWRCWHASMGDVEDVKEKTCTYTSKITYLYDSTYAIRPVSSPTRTKNELRQLSVNVVFSFLWQVSRIRLKLATSACLASQDGYNTATMRTRNASVKHSYLAYRDICIQKERGVLIFFVHTDNNDTVDMYTTCLVGDPVGYSGFMTSYFRLSDSEQ